MSRDEQAPQSPANQSAQERRVGRHRMRTEEDVVFLGMDGDMDLDESKQIHAELERVLAEVGRAFVLVDMSHGGNTAPDARRFIAEWNRRHRVSGAVIFGGSIPQRAAATLVFAAIRLFRPGMFQLAMLKTEAEARAWIDEQRSKLLARTSASR